MAALSGFAPWIIYWVLVGNVPFTLAALVALGVAVFCYAVGRVRGAAGRTLEIGAIATFAVLTVLTVTAGQVFLERWILPLSGLGILLVAVTGVLAGRPFMREFAEADQPPEVIKSELFGPTTARITWIWIAAFAGMTISSAIPPIVLGDASLLDTTTALSFICYWVLPFVLVGAAIVGARVLTERMVTEATSPHAVRKSSFVAFKELEIDQLYFLARERAEREAGPDMETYDIKLGSSGLPLTGDETRESWPMSYKLRARRG